VQNRAFAVTSGAAEGARPASAGRAPDAAPVPGDGAAGAPGQPLLQLRGIGKHFGPVQALSDINLDVPAGQVTALVGDNGAGKTTLIKCIAGIWEPNGGEMLWNGKPVHLHSPRDASALGIATVYQDLALCDNLDIVQNMQLGHEPLRYGLLDEITMEQTTKTTLADLAVTTVRSVRQPVGSLSGGQRQAVAVAKAVMQEARLVIMDEPTAALGVSQTELVLSLITRLAERGHGVIVISHNLNDVFRVADRFAVLYLGRLVAVGPTAEFDRQSVVDLMTTGATSRQVNGASQGVPLRGGSNGAEDGR
jgi:D-xylose transport system ATP-binding protein